MNKFVSNKRFWAVTESSFKEPMLVENEETAIYAVTKFPDAFSDASYCDAPCMPKEAHFYSKKDIDELME